MKLNPFCMCCAVNKQEKSIRRFSDMDRKTEYMKKVMGVLANAAEEDCAPSISQNLKELYSSFWDQPEEDYSRIKHEFNRLMLDVEDSVEKKIRQSADPLETALVYARIGNYIDFAALAEVSQEVILSLLDSENKDPLDQEEYSHFLEELRQAKKLVYITDNCGEIVLDKLAVKILKEQYGGKVPDNFDALLKLPGVGRKSANLIMGDVFGKPAIVTDTHCIRLVNRMGLVDGIKEPKKVEMALWKLIPPEEGSDFCHRLVFHGRDVCTARTKPHCEKCCVQDLCAKNGIN